METLFLSHSHGDKDLAGAVKDLIETCFAGHIEVKASSSSPSDGGPAVGGDWLTWIHDQVRGARFTAVVLTPNSVSRPWLMWEAGAVSGVSLATKEVSTVIPLVFRLSMEQVPSPLRSRRAALGEDSAGIQSVLDTLQAVVRMPDATFKKFVATWVPGYLDNVATALRDTPPLLTESSVQDWLDRILYFERTDRRSEIGQLHRAMVNVFAPGANAYDTPLDVRLHRRLGDIYLFAKRSKEALQQYELALRLSPRDVFLLHKKGLALLEDGDEPGAEKALNALLAIDAEATRSSTEIAGLKGRLFWQKYRHSGDAKDLRAARDAYADGLAFNGDSHYMADNVGQLSLLLGDRETARAAFEKGLAALQKTGDRGYWAMATRASCNLGLGRKTEGLAALRQVLDLSPEPAVIGSIRRGLARLHEGLGLPDHELREWEDALTRN